MSFIFDFRMLKNKLFTTSKDLKSALSLLRDNGFSIGFVPTMGALHAGHLSLVDKALSQNDWVVISIFINPEQFNSQEDLAKYPRTLESDLLLLEFKKKCIIFHPEIKEIYPITKSFVPMDLEGFDDEMEGMKKTDINFFKSLLSQSKVTVREVYGKRDTTNDRTVSFLGSVNKDEFLKDEENRRFPVIAISGVDFNLLHQIDVQQLWAQAKEEYDSGMFKNYADSDMRDCINKFNDRHYMQSDITYYIQRYIGKPQKGDRKDSIQTLNPTEIKIHIQQAHKAATDIMIPDNQLNRAWIAQELKRLGYEGVNHSNVKKFKVKIAPIDSYDKEDKDPILDRVLRVGRLN